MSAPLADIIGSKDPAAARLPQSIERSCHNAPIEAEPAFTLIEPWDPWSS
ncbi:MAG: hypothetical protein WDN31_03830 [Hyphomicrobium sp.]